MQHKIEKIEQPLRDRIINCALKEFAIHGFDRASYNYILKEAGINKGRFYQYVKSKKELFDYLIEYIVEKVLFEIDQAANLEEKDVIERFRGFAFIALDFYARYPYCHMFISMIKRGLTTVATKDLRIKHAGLKGKLKYENIDKGLFKDKNNIEEKINILAWTLDNLIKHLLLEAEYDVDKIDKQKAIADIDKYFNLFKQIYYK